MAAYSNLQLNESILLVSGEPDADSELLGFRISWVCYLSLTKENNPFWMQLDHFFFVFSASPT